MFNLKGNNKNIEDEIVEEILNQQDKFQTLLNVFTKLPSGLVEWLIGYLKTRMATKYYIEIGVVNTLYSSLFYPGDILVKSNREPKKGDLIEIGQRLGGTYLISIVKVLESRLEEGTLYVSNIMNPEIKGRINVGNMLYVIERIIKFKTQEWKKVAKKFNLELDNSEVEKWIKSSIRYIKKAKKFHDKEKNLKKLKQRLRLVKNDRNN